MTTLIISLPAIVNVGALLILFFFIYAYMGKTGQSSRQKIKAAERLVVQSAQAWQWYACVMLLCQHQQPY